MKVALLDVNVLLALAWPNHQHHERAHGWFLREHRHGWASCALTQAAFVRLSSHPAFTPLAVTPSEAAALLARQTSHETHRFWKDLPPITVETVARALGHQQVTDAYLVEIARHHDGRLVTFEGPVQTHARTDDEVTVIDVSQDRDNRVPSS